MKRASYRAGVAWIARNVPSKWEDPYNQTHPLESLTDSGRVAVGLVAELFGVSAERVAGDVLREWGLGVRR
jgi:hypothetical protein